MNNFINGWTLFRCTFTCWYEAIFIKDERCLTGLFFFWSSLRGLNDDDNAPWNHHRYLSKDEIHAWLRKIGGLD